ncbi:ABC transporter related [Methylorubrum populi BJ001]|jgi:ribosome-dependent ATPase|uniref:ABC transporter related n=1 Tax=Methylorubrum populi (strain ATCC BAA-705 / NCIMB 13946 / BJ001) TaxID=441620 RepID=B1ZK62_METPB|nr:ribosome-associated ATPase/putative transporter RbbA [Methylorubrum populi]ACB78714.1 ABC transporter related [Methylorubrum populi BJ001]OAH36365.1 multidrug ABC transporter ATP-binding protein [Methylorubrum populi]PZP67569.1 MAG: ABC transporter ATP-binding protein/permease [Methylorubrum populi]
MNDAAEIARLDHVSHRYGRTVALDDVSLGLPAGRMVGVIGPDGVGKSTLLALVAGVRRIQTGEVLALGGDMAQRRHRAAQGARIAYMPQGLGRNLYPTLSVFENIDFHGRLFGQGRRERRARITDLLTATGLDPFEARPAGKLSGGMKQKLSLCCALIHDPDLLILDEPTTGVDPLSRGQFWDLIGSIRARRPGMSVVVATAYMDEASRFEWLVAMDDGKVIASGSPAELLERTAKPDMEAAFIALLPPEKQAQHQAVVLRPRPPGLDAEPAIEAEHLTRRFGSFTAVDDVSFRIGRGEIFGFLGSNGCGKSTTMKMLTGLLPATEGTARLFGRPVGSNDMETRRNVGYMSQAFSLYSELTVLQNLELHAQLYHLPPHDQPVRIRELLDRYELEPVRDARPDSLPLGIKQRLQLAVAVLHRPAMLILDEPTSGVDPIARDAFWRTLIDLSRDEGVTIFLSTHFMNEAERCDRISLMHAGKVLAVGAPADLVQERGSASLEDCFIGYLAEAAGIDREAPAGPEADLPAAAPRPGPHRHLFDPRRLWAYARRETMELLRDPIRIAFAFLGPMLLMVAFGYGISFDVEHLRFSAFDQDNSPESRQLVEAFTSSRYFSEQAPIRSAAELDERFRSGRVQIALEIPPRFGLDLQAGRVPEVAVWLDGAMPFRAETSRGYVTSLASQYAQQLATERTGAAASGKTVSVETRFRYNQAFRSVNAMVPSVMMLLLILIPAIMSAIAVVREKETGSIANFRSTPVTKFEFLVGKQLPYILIAMISFLLLVLVALIVFDVPVKGSFIALALGTLFYVAATTGFGQFISTFMKTQVAAVFATALLSIIPAVNFSGLLVPISSLSGSARIIGLSLPPAWYQPVTAGAFTKGLPFIELAPNIAVLAGFAFLFLVLSQLLLRKQEA